VEHPGEGNRLDEDHDLSIPHCGIPEYPERFWGVGVLTDLKLGH
jgi:hypothetical protein